METPELGKTSKICQKSFDALIRWFSTRIHREENCHVNTYFHIYMSQDVTDGSRDQFTLSENASLHSDRTGGGIFLGVIEEKNITAITDSKRKETNSRKSPRTTFTAFALHTTHEGSKQLSECKRDG